MWILIVGLVIFLGIHSVQILAPDFRNNFITQRGEGPWKGLFSIISLIGLILIVWGYGEARYDNTFFYDGPTWLKHLNILVMWPTMIFLLASQFPAGRIKKKLKNPMLIAVKIWAIMHLLMNGDLASYLLFGSLLVWAVLLVINTNRRGNQFPQETSTRGDILSVVAGTVVWAALTFYLHEYLFGIPAITPA